MLSVYQVISGNLNKAVNEHGEAVLKQPLVKNMRVVKKEILTLLSSWLSRAFEQRAVCITLFIFLSLNFRISPVIQQLWFWKMLSSPFLLQSCSIMK